MEYSATLDGWKDSSEKTAAEFQGMGKQSKSERGDTIDRNNTTSNVELGRFVIAQVALASGR